MSGWFALLIVSVPLIVLELAAVAEVLFRRPDLTASRRVAWCVALVALPYVSLLVYVVARPPRRGKRPRRTAADDEPRAEALVVAVERHVRGELDDTGFERAIAIASEDPGAG